MSVFFRVLGSFEVLGDDGQDLTPSAPKLRRVLALLILNHNKVVQTSSLVDELWGERPPSSSLTTLQTYVYQLRKMLPSAGGAASELLLTKPELLGVLDPEGLKFSRKTAGLWREVNGWLTPALKEKSYSAALKKVREFRQREMLRIAARDLGSRCERDAADRRLALGLGIADALDR